LNTKSLLQLCGRVEIYIMAIFVIFAKRKTKWSQNDCTKYNSKNQNTFNRKCVDSDRDSASSVPATQKIKQAYIETKNDKKKIMSN